MRVVMVCFANTCRSPVAESLLAATTSSTGDVDVTSRGTEGGPGIVPVPMGEALVEAGVDVVGPLGRVLDRDTARGADLLLFMERALLREAVVRDTSVWPKSFTLREFARRAMIDPPDPQSESFEQWLALLHAKRSRTDLLGADTTDDVPDPGLSGSLDDYREMIADLRRDVGRIAPMLTGWTSTSE